MTDVRDYFAKAQPKIEELMAELKRMGLTPGETIAAIISTGARH